MFRQLLKDYLGFNRKDRIGAIIIVVILLIIYLLPIYFSKPAAPLTFNKKDFLTAVDSLNTREDSNKAYSEEFSTTYQYEPTESKSFVKGALFQFDPNTLPTEGWQRLGLNERTIRTINNFRNKGGKFYKPEDLKKIWGLPEEFYQHVKDHISVTSASKDFEKTEFVKYASQNLEKKPYTIEVNSSDTSALIFLPGIGSKLSARIINFREKLGGFYSVEQIGETYGLPDSTFQKIKGRITVNASSIRKLNINTASKDELKVHPYIRWNLANAIVEYRNQHGLYKDIEQLRDIALIDEATYKKIIYYVDIQ